MNDKHFYAETAYGRLAVPGGEDLISRFLKTYGEWAPHEHTLANLFLNCGDILVDAGAFLGTFSLGCNASKSLKKTICVEANSLIQPLLELNLEKNCSSPYEVVKKAVGTDNDKVQMCVDENNFGASYVIPSPAGTDKNNISTTSLKNIREQYGEYQLLKLDIEGCELTALKQDQAYLHRAKPVLFIEANETMKTCQVANYCRWLGYKVFYISLPVFQTKNFNMTEERIFGLAHEALLIALPPTTDFSELPQVVLNDGGFCVSIDNSNTLIKALWETPRWANKKWVDMSNEQLIAILGRAQKQETFTDFMTHLMPEEPFG